VRYARAAELSVEEDFRTLSMIELRRASRPTEALPVRHMKHAKTGGNHGKHGHVAAATNLCALSKVAIQFFEYTRSHQMIQVKANLAKGNCSGRNQIVSIAQAITHSYSLPFNSPFYQSRWGLGSQRNNCYQGTFWQRSYRDT